MARDRNALPKFLYERYGRIRGRSDIEWDDLEIEIRIKWEHEAETVIENVLKLAAYKIVKDGG